MLNEVWGNTVHSSHFVVGAQGVGLKVETDDHGQGGSRGAQIRGNADLLGFEWVSWMEKGGWRVGRGGWWRDGDIQSKS